MGIITQADLAKSMHISRMQVSRIMREIKREKLPLSDFDILRVLTIKEIQKFGFTSAVAIELLNEFEGELRFLHNSTENNCWVLFVEREDRSYRLTSLSKAHLHSVIDAVGMALVLPLHCIFAAAQYQLAKIKKAKAKQVAV
ncbi:hypothetical protein KHQ08_09365 [Pseudochrobactrum algeriensis]|uniref:hypothetical protein n=1 Tax=Pseudochrobactrum algeriensis TaxID=2834768 RepID=UPI001BD043F6|nr:hypothetical protein [Pseudochrobactrum algeriensis]QVQ38164.1 hypothetical protein KHQ08_09365 [Pseudochrobactrum algeriensis]QVQ41390.1 hypothetical protein KHQ07_07670 [Pseudochrobactrum algeriensis]QVQ45312.1 hypothetical protein KHQ09_09625 [Pseudochrobactrum algeriensis]